MASADTTEPKKRGGRPRKITDEVKLDGRRPASATHEFSSYMNSSSALSQYYFGFNILDAYSPEDLASLVKDPITNNEILRKFSLMLYGSTGMVMNTINYMVSMPTLSHVLVAKGKSASKKKKNKEIASSVLSTIKHKEFIRDALLKGAAEGTTFYYFETTEMPFSNKKTMSDYEVLNTNEINEMGINASIISLPTDFTSIVGIKNNVYVLAFDLSYFNSFSGEEISKALRKYPKEIRDAYNNRGTDGNSWVVLDEKKTIVHKIYSKREEKWGRPIVLPAIRDILYSDYFTDTKRSVLDEINNKIVYQTFPEGAQKGVSALTKRQQEAQHEAVKRAVLSKNNRGGTSFFSVSAGTKIGTIDPSNTDIFDDKYENNLSDKIALSLGFAASLLNGVGAGSFSSALNNLELVESQIFQWIEQIQAELNKCINHNIIKDNNNKVECHYLPITHVNKKAMVDYTKELYLQGSGSLSMWCAAVGIDPEVYFALLDQEYEDGIYDKYKPHQTSFTLPGNVNEKKSGRPEEDNPTENTMKSRANNGNNIPSPSDGK